MEQTDLVQHSIPLVSGTQPIRRALWRLDPEKSGISCCIGDIGTHAFDMLEYVSGEKIESVLADLNYLYEDNKMDIDGTVLLRCSK